MLAQLEFIVLPSYHKCPICDCRYWFHPRRICVCSSCQHEVTSPDEEEDIPRIATPEIARFKKTPQRLFIWGVALAFSGLVAMSFHDTVIVICLLGPGTAMVVASIVWQRLREDMWPRCGNCGGHIHPRAKCCRYRKAKISFTVS